ncbi:MAG TPA: hypothetical protein VMZ28_29015, partial [Kofleriaceae bacterium]|nr:hypothetical protein [Kofleriaceae bacterium]
GTGSMTFTAGARGQDSNNAAVVASAASLSTAAQVLAPAALTVTSFTAPGQVNRAQPFAITMTVKNNGGATANNVVPFPIAPTATVTEGAGAVTSSAPAAQNIAAGASATFTWDYVENGTAPGSIRFTGAARGTSAAGGAVVSANSTQTNLTLVVSPPALVVESVNVPAKVSRGQSFPVTVAVRNGGGSPASGVVPSLQLAITGGAAATMGAAPTAVTLAGGARTTYTYMFTENGSASGTLRVTAGASGTDQTGAATSATPLQSIATTVETPAVLTVTGFVLPGSLERGKTFALSMTVTNSGQAAASGVVPVPAPPMAMVTGGVMVMTTSPQSAVTVPGGGSQTFTWLYSESGSASGTLAFTGGASGVDANSGKAAAAAAKTSNAASVATLTGCNGSALYSGFGGRSLDGDRLDQVAGTDRLRIKPYTALVAEYNRVLGATPSFITGQNQTFGEAPARWSSEQELSAVSMIQAYKAAFQGCLTFTASATAYAANPTTTTATTECAKFQTRFWSRIPTATETNACVAFATGTANNDANPRRRWAYTCAAVLTSVGFLAE